MNQEQHKHEQHVDDTDDYFSRCDDNCDELHPDRCAHLVQQDRTCHYNVIKNIINDDQNTMIGVCYWTKLIDGGHAWIIHPIDCDETVTMEKLDSHDVLKAYSHVYNKQMEFDMDLIQFVEHGPSYVEDFNYIQETFLTTEAQQATQISLEQLCEFVYSVRVQRMNRTMQLNELQFVKDFEFKYMLQDVIDGNCEIKNIKDIWVNLLKKRKKDAIDFITEEYDVAIQESDTEAQEEIKYVLELLDDCIDYDMIDKFETYQEVLTYWPAILLPGPVYMRAFKNT